MGDNHDGKDGDAAPSLQEPLLPADANGHERPLQRVVVEPAFAEPDVQPKTWKDSLKLIVKEAEVQYYIAAPVAVNLILTMLNSSISLSFVGHLGTLELAAAAMATTGASLVGRMVLIGLTGAIDTLASQAFGAGNMAALPIIFQRSVLFLYVHCLPLSCMLMGVPYLLRLMGNDVDLCWAVAKYTAMLLPGLYMEPINRPLVRLLVCQGITRPQLYVGLIVLPVHVGLNYAFIYGLKLGYLGAALAMSVSTALSMVLLCVLVALTGLQDRVWGHHFMPQALKRWRRYASLAYPACIMTIIEASAFDGMTIIAGLLPDPASAIASVAVALNIYGILYMTFLATGMASATRVGNFLGAGQAQGAKRAALAAIMAGPLQCLVVAALLVEPHSQRVVVKIFTSGADEQLLGRLHRLLLLVAAMEFFDGMQTVISGIIKGAGKQSRAALVNFVAYYCFAIPLAVVFAFVLHWSVEGLYLGLLVGPALQVSVYCVIVACFDWDKEAALAHHRLATIEAATPAASIAPSPFGKAPVDTDVVDVALGPGTGVALPVGGSPRPLGRQASSAGVPILSPCPSQEWLFHPSASPAAGAAFPERFSAPPQMPRIESNVDLAAGPNGEV